MIVFVIPKLQSGGTEWQLLYLLEELSKDYEICLWVYQQEVTHPGLYAAFQKLPNIHIIFGANLHSLKRIARLRPKLIISYAINYYLPEICLKLITGATLFTERRNLYHWLKTDRRLIVQETVRNVLSRVVICLSNAVSSFTRSLEYGVVGKLNVIYNCVIPFDTNGTAQPAIVVAANIKAGKGIEIAAKAFDALRKCHVGDDLDFAIYGREDDFSIWKNLPENLKSALYRGETGRERIFDNAVALLHLSESEGFGSAVLEGISVGVIPILSDIPVHRELFNDCAIFVSDLSETISATQSIILMRETAPQDFADMSTRCREVAARYSVKTRADAYRKLIDAHIN